MQGYKYGFKTNVKPFYQTKPGLNKAIVKEISEIKKEPNWMLDYRMKGFEAFKKLKLPDLTKWKNAPDLSFIDFQSYIYYTKVAKETAKNWKQVDKNLKYAFDKVGIIDAQDKQLLAGVHTQFESESIYENIDPELTKQGVIFTDTDSALKHFPKLFKKYFGKIISASDNKLAALNWAVWSGGTFIYVPPGIKVKKPLQSYFRINAPKTGQFERTLIIVDEGAEVEYIEGCSAPVKQADSLHAAVVEIFVEKNAKCRYTTIQNWADNILNLVTKRAIAKENAFMEWVDGNIGSMITMKYPSILLAGKGAKGSTISMAVGTTGMFQDSGAKMIHLAPNTTSKVIAKSIARESGIVNYRGLIEHAKGARNSKTKVECDTLLIGADAKSDTLPTNRLKNNSSIIEHEATISKISEEQLYYLQSRGLTTVEAIEMIIVGFVEPFARELPMEYAVELNQLLRHEMEGSVG